MTNQTVRSSIWLVGITALSLTLVLAGRAIMPWGAMFPDFITYWTAGTLVSQGQNPYDAGLQLQLQRTMGWDRSVQGRGLLDFLPYYYPPWLAVACAGLVPLGHEWGKAFWFFINLEMLFLTGYLLRQSVPGLPASIPLLAVPFFLPTLQSLLIGQTSILIAFLCAATWRLMDRDWDFAAGATLACTTTKPQLAAVLVIAAGVWACRGRRWRFVSGFATTFFLLCAISAVILPSWPLDMIRAIGQTRPPTETFPWLGNSWFLILKTMGLSGWLLYVSYAVIAIPAIRVVGQAALEPHRPFYDVLAPGLLAAFFVAPYARHYDFVVLLIPAFVLIGVRLSELSGATLLVGLLLVPYLQLVLLARYSRLVVPGVDFQLECTYFWIPVIMAALWLGSTPDQRRPSTVPGV